MPRSEAEHVHIFLYDITAALNSPDRFFKAEEKLIPEIHSVAEFMAAQLGDCSGDKDDTFMTLRVQRIILT